MHPYLRATDGVVLDSRDHGESDLIITLFCRDGGRCSAIAKGARKSLRRFVNKLELFSFLHVTLRQRSQSGLALLEDADLHAGFIHLRQDIRCYTAASVLREFTLLATRDGETDERTYLLLLWALHQLDQNEPHLQIVMLFLLRFLDGIGYRPELGRCVGCGSTGADQGDCSFSIPSGSLVCRQCQRTGRKAGGIPLSGPTVAMLQDCQDRKLTRLAGMRIPPIQVYEALNILHRYGRHVLDRDIISWAMLRATLQHTKVEWANQR